MKVKDLVVGAYDDPLEVVVEEAARVHTQLLRVTLKDDSGSINLIFEGSMLCAAFNSLKAETTLKLNRYVVSGEVERFQKYFPPQIRPSSIAEHGTNRRSFIIVTAESIPEMQLGFWKASLHVPAQSALDNIDLAALYTRPESTSPTKPPSVSSVIITQEQFSTLAQLRTLIGEAGTPGSCYAIVLDCTSSYSVSNSTDVLLLLKVTDESIYPEYANVQVFHQPNNAVPKVVSYGDVLRVQNCMFKLFKGVLTGTMSAQSKSCRLTLFTLDSEELTPYGQYKGTFTPGLDHHRHMLSIRRWAKPILADSEPPVLSSSVTLSKAQNSECDVLARVFAKNYVGTEETDPIILFLYDAERSASMVIDRSREKMTKWLSNGDTVRIRSVSFEENRLLPSCYTDILKIPPFLIRRQLPQDIHQEEILQRSNALFASQKGPGLISNLAPEHRAQRAASFVDVSKMVSGDIIRTKGFVVHVQPTDPGEVRGYYCKQCRNYTHMEICPCGRETDVRCQVNLVLWDGKNDNESDLLRVSIKERQVDEFLGALDWQQALGKMLSPESVLEVVLVKEEAGLVLTGTSLKA